MRSTSFVLALCCVLVLAVPGHSQGVVASTAARIRPVAAGSYSVKLVKDIAAGSYSGLEFTTSYAAVGDIVYFHANQGPSGPELWRSDGSDAGTKLVQDVGPWDSWGNPEVVSIGNSVYFTIYTYAGIYDGSELWKTDGSDAGTERLVATSFGVPPYVIRVTNLTPVGTKLFYITWGNGYHLWVTDGSPGGQVELKGSLPQEPLDMIDLNGTLIYAMPNSGSDAIEIWRSDGTLPGTALVDTVPARVFPGVSFVRLGSSVFFIVSTNTTYELWKTDGTIGGATERVATLNSATGGGIPSLGLTPFNNALYFIANDGMHGAELWRSDGTDAGTTMVKDINPGADSGAAHPLTASGGRLLFSGTDGITGYELWQSDGTADGTSLVADLSPGVGNSFMGWIAAPDGLPALLSIQTASVGYQLWQSDGTEAGTVAVPGFGPSDSGSRPFTPIVVGNMVYFSAADADHGRELWVAEGTALKFTAYLSLVSR